MQESGSPHQPVTGEEFHAGNSVFLKRRRSSIPVAVANILVCRRKAWRFGNGGHRATGYQRPLRRQ